jgi:hypothetical protein
VLAAVFVAAAMAIVKVYAEMQRQVLAASNRTGYKVNVHEIAPGAV